MMDFPLNSLGVTHKFMAEHIKQGDLCIDATAGKGRDTAFLCSLVGDTGKVLAFDIQSSAVEQTQGLIKEKGFQNIASVYLDSHENMGKYADKETVDAIMFNLGWLPGGNHNIFSKPESTISAIKSGLELLKPGGVMSVCIYHGKETGTAEKDALLPFFETVDNKKYTVLKLSFLNRTGEVPIPILIIKENLVRK